MNVFRIIITFALLSILLLSGCGGASENDRPLIVTTTMMLEDAVKNIVGDKADVIGIMGPGVDPHIYRATPGDFTNMDRADLVIYNGLFLEARLAEVLGRMDDKTFAAAEVIPSSELIEAYEFGGNYDPHVWFDVSLWTIVVEGISDRLISLLPDHEELFRENSTAYLAELHELHDWVKAEVASIPDQRRVLITAHDAFSYFGKAYDMEVRGLQGLSTQSEYGLQDVSRMVSFIIEREIPAIFLETSIAPRSIQSLINGVEQRGGSVELGGELFSDAMGRRGTTEGTYPGMVRHNVNTIVGALK